MNKKKQRKLEKEFNRHLQKRLRGYTYKRIEEAERGGIRFLTFDMSVSKANEVTGKQKWYEEQSSEIQMLWYRVVKIVWDNLRNELKVNKYGVIESEGIDKYQVRTKAYTSHDRLMDTMRNIFERARGSGQHWG